MGSIVAAVVCVYVLQEHWHLRRRLQVWLVLAAYLLLQFSVVVPALGKLESLPHFYIYPVAIIEIVAVTFVIRWVTEPEVDEISEEPPDSE
jgi:hypothetical protein